MPFAYPDLAQLKLAIIARVAAGERVKAICAEAGMPDPASVQVWRRADPAFASDLAAARRKGDWARVYGFDEAVAAGFVARLAAGETERALLAKPGMPSQRAYAYWRRTNVGFQYALAALKPAREDRRLRGLKGRYRPFDQAVADKIMVAVTRGAKLRPLLSTAREFPSLAVLERWRREQPDWSRALKLAMTSGRMARWRGERGSLCTPELMEEIETRIAAGASLRSLGAEPDMPSPATLYHWMRRRPAFAKAVADASDFRDWMYADQMIGISVRLGPLALAAAKREAAPLQLRVNQLAKRPGWKWRR